MAVIESDNREAEKHLRVICDLIETHGGEIHPSLVICCENGALSVLGTKTEVRGKVLKVPHALLLPYDEFTLGIENNEIVVKACSENVTKDQAVLMEHMLALYACTDKLSVHRKTCPWLALRGTPEILRYLVTAREGTDINMIRKEIEKRTMSDDFVIESFFKNRLLGCKLHRKEAKKVKVLMPILDFMDHHLRGSPYQNNYEEASSYLSVTLSQPIEGQRGCYARYGTLDALDTYLHYSFVDTGAPFIRSVPVEVDLGEIGVLKIHAQNRQVAKADIPESLSDLQLYMPVINVHHSEKRAEISHLLIPQEHAPRSMYRILEFAISLLAESAPEMEKIGRTIHAEREILKQNIHFYAALSNLKDSIGAHQMLEQLTEGQAKKLIKIKRLKNF